MSTRAQSPFTFPLLSFPSARQGDICQDSEIDIKFGSITESPECDERVHINLGAESPASILKLAIDDRDDDGAEPKKESEDEWGKSGIAVHTDVPMRRRSWRSSSFSEKRKLYGKAVVKDAAVVDRDCGICFEVAITPCRMVCCGNVFCLNHISDWLYGSSSDGRCPSCKEMCTFVQEVPATHPTDGKHIDYGQSCSSEPGRSVILLLLQPSEGKSSSSPLASSDSVSPSNSGSRAGLQKPPPVAIRPAVDPSRDAYFLGPCRFHLNSSLVVLVGRMVGRVLSVVGLTLILFVLLT